MTTTTTTTSKLLPPVWCAPNTTAAFCGVDERTGGVLVGWFHTVGSARLSRIDRIDAEGIHPGDAHIYFDAPNGGLDVEAAREFGADIIDASNKIADAARLP